MTKIEHDNMMRETHQLLAQMFMVVDTIKFDDIFKFYSGSKYVKFIGKVIWELDENGSIEIIINSDGTITIQSHLHLCD